MPFHVTLEHHYPGAVAAADFADWTEWALARVGFRPTNALPLVGVCRDELMLGFAAEVTRVWGPAFDIASLGGLVFLGRTGIAAALGHVPGEDGRHRFVVFCFPHIGIDEDGAVGCVRRRGMHAASTACGALAAFRDQLDGGRLDLGLDPADPEMSLLRLRLLSALRYGDVPDLVALTEVARQVAGADVTELVSGLGDDAPVDVAYLSGVVVHTPDGRDLVGSVMSSVVIDGIERPLDH